MIRQFDSLDVYTGHINHGVTTSNWGSFKEENPNLEENISKLQKECGIERPITTYQVHGNKVLKFDEHPAELFKGDALITNTPNLPLMAKVADCQGVLMYDPVTHSIASVHSGWRGSTMNIIGKTVETMEEAFGTKSADILVAVSPSLGPCCATFSDPIEELPEFCHKFIVEKNRVDFWALTFWQCLEAGISGEKVEVAEECTKCQPGYYSHRNGDVERMGVFITLL